MGTAQEGSEAGREREGGKYVLPGSPGQRRRSFLPKRRGAFSETGKEGKWRWGGEFAGRVGKLVEVLHR